MNHVADAQWKSMQLKTFTKWINARLKKSGMEEVADLYEEAKTGSPFAKLFQALGKGTIVHTKNPRSRIVMMENIKYVIDFIVAQGIRLVNIGSADIVDGDEKLILGLVWTIISRMSMSEALGGESGRSHNAALLEWVQSVTRSYEGVRVTNFSTSWQDGLAFNAIIHRFRPECVDWTALSADTPRENLESAFEVAEAKLDISRLLDVEDLAGEGVPDEKSVMTYVFEFYKKFKDEETKLANKEMIADFLGVVGKASRARNSYTQRALALSCARQEMADQVERIRERAEELGRMIVDYEKAASMVVAESASLAVMLDNIHDIERSHNIRVFCPDAELLPESLAVGFADIPRVIAPANEAANKVTGPAMAAAVAFRDALGACCAVEEKAEQVKGLGQLQTRIRTADIPDEGGSAIIVGGLKENITLKVRSASAFIAKAQRNEEHVNAAINMFKVLDLKQTGTITLTDLKKIFKTLGLDLGTVAVVPDPITLEAVIAVVEEACLAAWSPARLREAFADIGECGYVRPAAFGMDEDFMSLHPDAVCYDDLSCYVNE